MILNCFKFFQCSRTWCSRAEVPYKKGVLKNFTEFTGTPAEVFPREFYKIFKNISFAKHLLTTVSDKDQWCGEIPPTSVGWTLSTLYLKKNSWKINCDIYGRIYFPWDFCMPSYLDKQELWEQVNFDPGDFF